jgi:hypothetical protein
VRVEDVYQGQLLGDQVEALELSMARWQTRLLLTV